MAEWIGIKAAEPTHKFQNSRDINTSKLGDSTFLDNLIEEDIEITPGQGENTVFCHHNVMVWKPFFALLALCEGNPLVVGGFSHKGPAMQSFDFFVVSVKKLFNKQLGAMTPMWRHCNVARRDGDRWDQRWTNKSCNSRIRTGWYLTFGKF